MPKKILALVLLLGSVLLPITRCFAEEETFTITTYYPSPYGSYNQLEVYRSVTYKPVNKDSLSSPREGELVYDSTKDKFYYYNGSKWVAQGGGGNIISLKCNWNTMTNTTNCTPANCPSNWKDLGTGCSTQAMTSTHPTYSTNTAGGFQSNASQATATSYQGMVTYYAGYCERWCQEQ